MCTFYESYTMQIVTSVSFLERITSINGNIFSVFYCKFVIYFYSLQNKIFSCLVTEKKKRLYPGNLKQKL